MFTHLHKKFFLGRNTPVFDSEILSCIRNVRLYSESQIPKQTPQAETLSLLKEYGFSYEEASKIVSKRPILVSLNPKTLKHKLDFFKSVNMSLSDLSNIITVDPAVFKGNLQNQILPSYNYLKSVLETNEDVNFSIRRYTWVLKNNIKTFLEPNLAVLRKCGFTDDQIVELLKIQPRKVLVNPVRFAEAVREVKETGFDPGRPNFIQAVQIISGLTKSSLEKKKGIYKKWGWSDKEIRAAFMKTPQCLSTADEKIEAVMNFLVNKMGWNASEVAECNAMGHSLENWTAPRCLVYQFLLSKGLVKEVSLLSLIKLNKEKFSASYVAPYSARFPEVLTLFESTKDKSLEQLES